MEKLQDSEARGLEAVTNHNEHAKCNKISANIKLSVECAELCTWQKQANLTTLKRHSYVMSPPSLINISFS